MLHEMYMLSAMLQAIANDISKLGIRNNGVKENVDRKEEWQTSWG
jgi:hypothetical protein